MDEQLIAYLRGVIELEKEIYAQNKLLNALNSEIAKLGKKRAICKNVAEQTAFSEIAPISFVICGAAGAALAAVITLFFLPSENFLLRLADTLGAGIKFGLIGAAFSIIPSVIVYLIKKRKENARNEAYARAYRCELEKDNERIAREKKQAVRLQTMFQTLYNKHTESASFLRDYYNVGVLYPKYRNLVACASFYEYLNSGRCTSLQGHGGAYDIYETEAKLDKLLTGMNQILRNLNQIRENQVVLYEAIQDGNRISAHLLKQAVTQSKQLTDLTKECDVISYNQECALVEARWGNFLNAYRAMS